MLTVQGFSSPSVGRLPLCWLAAGIFLACADSAPLEIGVALGTEGERGASLAIARLNAERGRGRPVAMRIVHGGWNTGAEIALQVAESLAENPRVMAVVGHANSSASLAGSEVYNQRHVVQVAPTTTAPLYSDAGPWSFRLAPSDLHQARFLADAARATGHGRVAVAYVNDDYGRALYAMTNRALGENGLRSVYDGAFVEDDTTNGPAGLVKPLVDAKPILLLWLGRAREFAQVAPLLRKALPDLQVLASDGFGGLNVGSDTSGVFDGVQYVRLVNVDRPDSTFQRVRTEYRRATGGQEITDQAALSYDAVMLVGAAIGEVGGNRERIREWMNHVGRDRPPFAGITGPIAFDGGGDPLTRYHVVTARAPRHTSVRP